MSDNAKTSNANSNSSAPLFRQWRSFAARWTATSRLEKFFPGSFALHAALVLLVAIPATRHHRAVEEQKVAAIEEREKKAAAEEQAKEEVVTAAIVETKTLLKNEVARAQLERLFSELTEGFLSDEMTEEYWDELLAELEPELEELAGMLEEGFDPVQLEEKTQELKEELVRKLADATMRDQTQPLRDELARKAEDQAKQLAEFFNREIAVKVGQPAGEQLQQMLAQAEAARRQGLEKADKDLTAALAAANQAAESLEKSADRLNDGGKKLAAGEAAQRTGDENAAKAQIRAEKSPLTTAGKQVATARAATQKAADQLAKGDDTAQLARNLKQSDEAAGGTAAAKTQIAADDAGEAKPASAAKEARAAAAQAKQLAADLQAAQNDVRRQLRPDAPEATELARAARQLRQGELAKLVDDQFGKLFQEKVVPGVVQKASQAAASQLKGGPGVAEKFRDGVKEDLENILGEGVRQQVKAGEQFAKGASQKMPGNADSPGANSQTAAKDGAASSVAKGPAIDASNGPPNNAPNAAAQALSDAAQVKLAPVVQRNLNAVVDAGMKALPAPTLGKPSAEDARRAELVDRLESLKNQLAVGRKDFLGGANAANLAAARGRFQNRQQSLSSLRRSGLRMDVEAYKKAAETMVERGRIEGEEFERRGADGEVSQGKVDPAIRPAMVSLPDPDRDETAPAAPVTVERTVASPAFPTNAFAGIPFLANDAITIDGDLSDWKDIPELKLYPVQIGAGPKPDVLPETQSARIAYCPRGVLVAVEAIDTSGKLENQHGVGQFWHNDCLEIYLDTINSKYSSRGEVNTHQFFAFPTGQKEQPEYGGYESYMVRGEEMSPRAHPAALFPRAGRTSPDGSRWTMELLIPKSLLRQGEIQPGRIIGLNLQLDTGTSYFYFWSNPVKGRISVRPNMWGDVQFLGSDAKLETLDETDQPLRSLVPGQAVRVRVIDPDMNLDDTRRDKISAVVRASAGDAETMILEETAEQSGVFVGSLATRLNIGRSQAGVLEVFEGERLAVEYIDQARAYGERNVPVKGAFGVGSIGTKIVGK